MVRIDAAPAPTPFRYLTSGTSSEAGYAAQMSALLQSNQHAAQLVALGSCNSARRFDDACLQRTADQLATGDPQLLYARGYSVSQADIRAAAGNDISAQVYDRHADGDSTGDSQLAGIFGRSWGKLRQAHALGLAWLPMHIAYARLRAESPGAPLLTDGVHATPEVQRMLASMSYVSRTGGSPTRQGLRASMALATRVGEETLRALATLNAAGVPAEDDLNARATEPLEPLTAIVPAPPPPWTCAHVDAGSAIGSVSDTQCEDHARIVYRWRAPYAGTFGFATFPLEGCGPGRSADTRVSVRAAGCGGAELAASDWGTHHANARLAGVELSLGEGEPVDVEVAHAGDVDTVYTSTLRVYDAGAEATRCDDGEDNDLDRLTDCDDPDCRDAPECPDPCPTFDLESRVGAALESGFFGGADFEGYCGEAPIPTQIIPRRLVPLGRARRGRVRLGHRRERR